MAHKITEDTAGVAAVSNRVSEYTERALDEIISREIEGLQDVDGATVSSRSSGLHTVGDSSAYESDILAQVLQGIVPKSSLPSEVGSVQDPLARYSVGSGASLATSTAIEDVIAGLTSNLDEPDMVVGTRDDVQILVLD